MLSGTKSLCSYEENFTVWSDDDFGRCFQHLFIVVPSHIILLISSLIYCIRGHCQSQTYGRISKDWVILLRSVVHILIILCEAGLIIVEAINPHPVSRTTLLTESLVLVSWVTSVLCILTWRHGYHNVLYGRDFNVLKVSWLLVLVSCSFEMYSAVLYLLNKHSSLDEEPFSVYESVNIFTRWGFYTLVLVLQIPRSNDSLSLRSNIINTSTEEPPQLMASTSYSLLSKLTFKWVNKLFEDAKESQFATVSELPFLLPTEMSAITNHCRLKQALQKYSTNEQADHQTDEITQPLIQAEDKPSRSSLLKSLIRTFGWTFLPLNLVKLVTAVLELSSPILLNLLLRDLESSSSSITSCILYLGLLVTALLINSFIGTHLSYAVNKLQLTVRGSVILELYSKMLNVNMAGLRTFSVGEITNLMSQDSANVSYHIVCFFDLWYMPLKLLVILYLLYRYAGVAVLAGVGFCVLLVPFNQFVAVKIIKYYHSFMKHRDKRIKLVHEMLSNMKSIKFFAWEERLSEKIEKIRNAELVDLRKLVNLIAVVVYFFNSAPVLLAFLIVLTFSQLNGQMSASTIFTVIALADQIIAPMNILCWVIVGVAEAWTSLKRLQKFFDLDENAPQRAAISLPFESQNVIEVENCSFYWKTPDECCLTGLQLQVNEGELMMVMGKAGAGKSSLLLALSQELNLLSGELRIKEWKDGAGIVLHDCWIKTGTFREAILDGSVYDPAWYERVVFSCALKKDIANFSEGDETQVGVNGSTLSGGQRLRVSLARAVYKDKQVYFIDDIFSGLDSAVVSHIMTNCINGILESKTRVVCCHNINLTSSADRLLTLDKGQITYLGLPQNIPNISGVVHEDPPVEDKGDAEEAEQDIPEYTEPRRYGTVDIQVYKNYGKAAGMCIVVVLFISLTGMQASTSIGHWWLTRWIKASNSTPSIAIRDVFSAVHNPLTWLWDYNLNGNTSRIETVEHNNNTTNNKFYLIVYGSLVAGNTVFTLIKVATVAIFKVSVATVLHKNMLKSVMNTSLDFFQQTPIGAVLNRFSQDIYSTDLDLPGQLSHFLTTFFFLISSIVMTSYGIPWVTVTVIPLVAVYYFIQRYYLRAVREVKRLYSSSKSPLFSHFEESVTGIAYIHCFRVYNSVQNLGTQYLEAFQRSSFCLFAANAWLQLRLELMATGFVLVAAMIILIEVHYNTIDVALLGLALTYALILNDILKELIESMINVEKEMIGAERVLQYTHDIPQELEPEDVQFVDYSWPSNGAVKFSNVSVRYKDCQKVALKNFSVTINPGEKVAIVGRTGAGKSTILTSLFRLVDLEGGSIVIDDTNIHDISAKVLREKLAILPQQPLIFSGTIRENIDPFEKYSDDHITECLKKCQLGDFLTEDNNLGLDKDISFQTISSGESQLLSLARIILNKSKVLCLDEATSNIDYETDKQLIQDIIMDQFKDSTVLTIAHRIDTIINYDKVIVLSQGSVVEEGSPQRLIEQPGSAFYKMAMLAGVSTSRKKDTDGVASSSVS